MKNDDIVFMIEIQVENCECQANDYNGSDGIRSGIPNNNYDMGWDRIFGKKDSETVLN